MDPTLLGRRPPVSRNSWALESEPSGAAAKAAPGSCNRTASEAGPAAMGTGSSRVGKAQLALTPPRLWLGPGQGSAPSRQGLADDDDEEEAACAWVAGRGSAVPLEPPDSDSELLDQVLEECGEDGGQLLPSPAPSRAPCHGCARRAEGSGGGEESDGKRDSPEDFLTRSTPGSNNFANQLPLKKPERQAKISYDCSEEELMATIEQEYCR